MNDALQSTALRALLKVYVTADQSEATGKTVAVTISKNGGAFGNPSAGATNATEIASGWYYVDLSTTDTGTIGPLIVRGTATACDPAELTYQVVKATNRGMTGIPDAAAGANSGLPVLSSSATALAYSVSSVSGAVGSVTGGVTVTTNNDKTGYALASNGLSSVTAWTVAITGNITGSLSGSVGSVTARVTANTDQLAGQTVTATAGVTFPSLVASTTNITAGTITTATNLTNLPSIPAGWLTANGIAANALNGKGDWVTSGNLPSGFGSLAIDGDGFVTVGTNTDKSGYDVNLVTIASAPVAVDTGTAGTISFYSGQYVAYQDGAISSGIAKIKAAVYDSLTISGDTLTLSDATTQQVSASGRVTTED